MSDRSTRLNALLQDHTAAVDEFFHRAAEVTSARWNVPRMDGKWSPAQEVKHVILAYEAFINDLAGAGQMRLVGTPLKRMMMRAVGLTIILWGRRMPPRARAPREVRPTEGDHEQQHLLNAFRDQTAKFDAIFRETWEKDPARCVAHPYFGDLDLVDAVKMCTVHTRHHAAVLNRSG